MFVNIISFQKKMNTNVICYDACIDQVVLKPTRSGVCMLIGTCNVACIRLLLNFLYDACFYTLYVCVNCSDTYSYILPTYTN